VESAKIGKNITINQAYGKGDALQLRTNATAGTFLNVTQAQAQAYAKLKTDIGLQNQDLIQYLQLSLIQNNPTGNMVLALKQKAAAAPAK
jgi:hypothetical protein